MRDVIKDKEASTLSKVQHFTHYLSFFSILLFSTAFSINAELYLMEQLNQYGLYKSFMEAFSEGYVKITIWFALFLFYFMLFSAIKLIANTVMELSIFFFCKSEPNATFPSHPWASTLYLGLAVISIFCAKSIVILAGIYLGAGIIAFALLIHKVADRLSLPRIVGVVFMHFMFWAVFLFAVLNVLLKLYNGVVRSIGI